MSGAREFKQPALASWERLHAERDEWKARALAAEADVTRLRARTHELQERADGYHSKFQARAARFAMVADEAREFVKDWPVDWTTDPPSQQPGGWWRYTSSVQRDLVIGLMDILLDAMSSRDHLQEQVEQARAVIERIAGAVNRCEVRVWWKDSPLSGPEGQPTGHAVFFYGDDWFSVQAAADPAAYSSGESDNTTTRETTE